VSIAAVTERQTVRDVGLGFIGYIGICERKVTGNGDRFTRGHSPSLRALPRNRNVRHERSSLPVATKCRERRETIYRCLNTSLLVERIIIELLVLTSCSLRPQIRRTPSDPALQHRDDPSFDLREGHCMPVVSLENAGHILQGILLPLLSLPPRTNRRRFAIASLVCWDCHLTRRMESTIRTCEPIHKRFGCKLPA
jgi:hypothetical protein